MPGKAELIDLMLDTVLGETAPPGELPDGWQEYEGLWDPDHAFEFGLQRVLDGIEVLVESRSRRAGGSRSKRAGS